MLCKGHGFCGAMGNDALWVTVVDVCIGSLVRARLGARGRFKVILLQKERGDNSDTGPPVISSTSVPLLAERH